MRWLATLTEPLWLALDRRLPLGRRGEDAAARYLRRLGYVIVARGQRDKIGEIDLVAVDRPHGRVRRGEDPHHARRRPSGRRGRRSQAAAADAAGAVLHASGTTCWNAGPVRRRRRHLARRGRGGRPIEHFKNAFEPVGFDGMFS